MDNEGTDESYFDAVDIIDWCTDHGWDIDRLLNACATVSSFEGMVQDILDSYLAEADAGPAGVGEIN